MMFEGVLVNVDAAGMDNDDIRVDIDVVKEMIFPHCSLEFQKMYMHCHMRKPKTMTFWKMAATVT